MLALRLPKEIEDRLDALAKKTGRTKSYYARQAIVEHLEDLEDIAMAEERMKDPDTAWLSLEEVIASIQADANEPSRPAAE